MEYFFELEGLTYALEKPKTYRDLYREAGFTDISIVDGSDWYRRRSSEEYALLKGDLYPQMLAAMGRKDADHFVESWRAMVFVCETGELMQTYFRATHPQTV
jgi:hypothetical protein